MMEGKYLILLYLSRSLVARFFGHKKRPKSPRRFFALAS